MSLWHTTICSFDVYTIDVFGIINLSTLLQGKYKVIVEPCQDDNELRFFTMSEAILTKKNYDFNDTKRTLLRQKDMDVYGVGGLTNSQVY
jgi:hypothetical protein